MNASNPVPPTPGKRLRYIRKDLKLSQGALSEQLDISQSTLSQIENDYYTLSLSAMLRLTDLHGVNSNWLITGQGEIFLKDNEGGVHNAFIPLVDAEAHAGYPQNRESVDYIATLDRFKLPGIEILTNIDNYRIFQIEGDSMEPTLFDGDYVVCQHRKEGILQLTRGQLAVIVTDSGVICKRFYQTDDNQADYILDSDNPLYQPEILEQDGVREVWVVRSRITKHFNAVGAISGNRLDEIEKQVFEIKRMLTQLTGTLNQSLT